MGTEKMRGIVIAQKQRGESGKQLLLLVKDIGRVWVFARGAMQAKSKLLATTQLFSYCDFIVFSGKGFLTLTQADLIESFYGIRNDMEKLAEAVYLAELLERSCPEGLEQNETLKLFLTTLTVLEKSTLPPSLVSRIFEIKYLQIFGALAEGCAVCENTSSPLYFDAQEGAFLCHLHKQTDNLLLLPAVVQALSFIWQHEGRALYTFALAPDALAQLDRIAKILLQIHMGVNLKSRSFSQYL